MPELNRRHKITLRNAGDARSTELLIDDVLLRGAYAITFEHAVDMPPRVTIQMYAREVDIEGLVGNDAVLVVNNVTILDPETKTTDHRIFAADTTTIDSHLRNRTYALHNGVHGALVLREPEDGAYERVTDPEQIVAIVQNVKAALDAGDKTTAHEIVRTGKIEG